MDKWKSVNEIMSRRLQSLNETLTVNKKRIENNKQDGEGFFLTIKTLFSCTYLRYQQGIRENNQFHKKNHQRH
jgi:hypothetical protein